MHFPTWVDLKGEDAVPETVHHVVVNVDPQKDKSWQSLHRHVPTDGVHANDGVRQNNLTPGLNQFIFSPLTSNCFTPTSVFFYRNFIRSCKNVKRRILRKSYR